MTLGSPLGVMAYHGGNLEVGTDLIADAVADRTGASRYVVRQPDDLRWHIPSRQFRPEESDRLAAFLDHVDEVITIHGYGRRSMFTTVLLGGRHRELAAHRRHAPADTLPGYEVIDDLDDIPAALAASTPRTRSTDPAAAGCRSNCRPRVRGNGPFWNGWDGGWPTPHTEDLVDGSAPRVDRGHGTGVRARAAPAPSPEPSPR